MVMDVTENEADAGALLGHLTSDQRERLDALDAAYVELLSSPNSPARADVEALADAVLTFYGEIAGRQSGLQKLA